MNCCADIPPFRRLSAAVAELPQREQRVLEMYYVQEMTLKEIGVVLGVARRACRRFAAQRSRYYGFNLAAVGKSLRGVHAPA